MIMPTRRTFLSGLPLLAVTPALPQVQAPHRHAVEDPVLYELAVQAALNTQAFAVGVPIPWTAYHDAQIVRTVAATLETRPAYRRQLSEALHAAVQQHGREAVLAYRPDVTEIARTAARLRIALTPPAWPTLDRALKGRALDAYLADDINIVLQRLAGQMERQARAIATFNGKNALAASLTCRAGDEFCEQEDECNCQYMVYLLEMQMVFFCSPWMLAVPELCVVAVALWTSWSLYCTIWLGCI